MRRIIISLILLVGFCSGTYPIYFKHIGMQEGLSQLSVMAIYQDNLGRMWFGTEEGISIYDGVQTKVYKPSEFHRQNANPIGNQTHFIAGDKDGNVFFDSDQSIIRKTKCFDFWERNVLFPKTKRSFFRTPKHPLPCPFPLNFSLLIITKKFGNLAKNRYICIV